MQDDGKIVVAGSSTSGTNNDFAIARYNADGSLDTTFGTSGLVRSSIGSAEGWAAIDIEVNGDILVGGFSVNGSGNKDFTLSRYLPNGTLDTTFGTSGITITDFSGGDDVIRGIVAPQWQMLRPYRGQTKTNGLNGKKRRYYEWDHTHGDIETYDSKGSHLGSMDPVTGQMTKPPVKGRKINL